MWFPLCLFLVMCALSDARITGGPEVAYCCLISV